MTTLIAQQLKLTRKDADAAVDAVFNSIAGSLEAGHRVELRGFGSFGLKERRERTGRNPKTGESVAVEAKRVLFFKTGKELRERVDS
ncbi:MAG: HU family DNA-binding protein [Magnetococcus sp. YQC-5]